MYRNTKNILSFIRGLGYQIELPEGLKDGPAVTEKTTDSSEEEIKHIKNILPEYKNGSVGILAKDEKYLDIFKKEFAGMKNVHVLSMIWFAWSGLIKRILICLKTPIWIWPTEPKEPRFKKIYSMWP